MTVRPLSRVAAALLLLLIGLTSMGGTAFAQTTSTPTPGTSTTSTPTPTPTPSAGLSLNPGQGPVGTSVIATASRFAPGDSIQLMFNGSQLNSGTADSNGSASLSFTVPNLPAGQYAVQVTGRLGGSASANFTINGPTPTPTPTPLAGGFSMSPSQGPVGTSVTVNVQGFVPGDTVILVFNGAQVGDSQKADTSGDVSFTFVVPNLAPGQYQVIPVGQQPGGPGSGTFTITSVAGLALSPQQGPSGTSVTANATGFTPGDTIQLLFNGAQIDSETANTSGSVSFPAFQVPSLAPNQYTAEAIGKAGGTASANFTVTAAGPTPTPVPGAPTATPAAAPALPHDDRFFSQTNFRIDNDAFWTFFNGRGGVRTFGFPSSRTFKLDGFQVQIFQRNIMQLQANGGVQTLNLLDPGLMPFTNINGSTFPAPDPSVVGATPPVSDPNYSTSIIAFTQQQAPDTFEGQAVNFYQTFSTAVTCADAFPTGNCQQNLLPGLSLEIWGAPTSKPTYDPTNRNFIYQRFQRGIMHFDAGCACTQGLLLADYFKAIITGQNLPSDLNQEAQSSKYYKQYDPTKPLWIARPNDLPASDLTYAFVPG
jgi:hypothetical protein